MFCTNCGNNITDGVKFCKNCGQPVAAFSTGGPQYVAPQPQETAVVQPAPVPEVMQEIKPEPAVEPENPTAPVAPVSPEPVVSAPETAPQGYTAPSVQESPAPEAPKKEKKSHKGLIITLCSVGGVILGAVATVLVMFFSYKGAVSDFEALNNNYYIDSDIGYHDVCRQAKDKESIFSLFDFSEEKDIMETVTQTIVDRNNQYASGLNGLATELDVLKKDYVTESFDGDIDKYMKEYKTVNGTEKYSRIGACYHGMESLIGKVKDYNVDYADNLINYYEGIPGKTGYAVLGNYETDYMEAVSELKSAAAEKKYRYIDTCTDTLEDLLDGIRVLNEAFTQHLNRKAELDGYLENFYLSDDNIIIRDEIYAAIDEAISNCDAGALEDEVYELEDLCNNASYETTDMINEVVEVLDDYESMYYVDSEEYYTLVDAARNEYANGYYLLALEDYRAAKEIARKVLSSYLYQLNVAQLDMTDFPMVNVYAYIKDFTTGEVLDDLDPMAFSLKEAISGSGIYKDVDILKAARLDGTENINMGIVADCSASMGSNFEYAKDAMKNLVGSLQTNVGDEAAVYAFSDTVERAYHYSGDKKALKKAITNMEMGNMTALYDALAFALSEITVQSGAKCVIAFTDGQENYSYSSKSYVVEKAQEFNVPIYIIGIGSGVNGRDLEDIATSTGGFYTNIYSISDMSDVYDRIYKEQKSMYLLQYESSDDSEDAEHEVIVTYEDEDIAIEGTKEYVPEQFKISGFIFYDSDRRYLTEEELDQLTEAEVRIAINEIYARCGYKFNLKQDMVDHFNALPWYHGTETDMDKVAKTFNEYEEYNVRLLVNYECKHGLNGRLDNKI